MFQRSQSDRSRDRSHKIVRREIELLQSRRMMFAMPVAAVTRSNECFRSKKNKLGAEIILRALCHPFQTEHLVVCSKDEREAVDVVAHPLGKVFLSHYPHDKHRNRLACQYLYTALKTNKTRLLLLTSHSIPSFQNVA